MTEKHYRDEAYRRIAPIIERVMNGNYPLGVVNVFSGLSPGDPNPDFATCRRIANYIWRQIEDLQEKDKLMADYNFELSIEKRGHGAIILFRFNPDDVRDLTPDKDSKE